MNVDVSTFSWIAGVGVVTLFFMGVINVLFIRKLISRIDFSAETVVELKKDIEYMQRDISAVSAINTRVVALEKQIAVLEYVARTNHPDSMECDS